MSQRALELLAGETELDGLSLVRRDDDGQELVARFEDDRRDVRAVFADADPDTADHGTVFHATL